MYVGTCNSMCPDKERYERSALRSQLSMFEPDQSSMVKEYRRAGADQEEPSPEDLRTPKALELTMDHLITKVMNDSRSKSAELALDWYDFLWDRLRAIRKDITQQNICDQASVRLVEKCTRFHVHSCYALKNVKDFDEDMNKRNLNDCLQMLRQMYTDLKIAGIVCQGELEFQIYDLLLHFDEDHSYTNMTLRTSAYRNTTEMKFVTQIYNSYMNNNYYKFFSLLEKADYLSSCILSLYINKMRLTGLKRMIVANTTAKSGIWFPSSIVIDSLKLDDMNDLIDFAISLRIELKDENLLFNRDLLMSLRQAATLAVNSRRLVETKMHNYRVGQLIHGKQQEDEVVRGFGSTPELEAVIKVNPAPQATWTTTIPEEEIPMGHMEIVREKLPEEDTIKKTLRLNKLKPTDATSYAVAAMNPLGETESAPINVEVDRYMAPSEEPQMSVVEKPFSFQEALASQRRESQGPASPDAPVSSDFAPQIVSVPDEVVAEPQQDLAELCRRAADLMPAGRFRTVTKVPTLKRPVEPPTMVTVPIKISPRKKLLDDLQESMRYEKEVNSQMDALMDAYHVMSYRV